MVEVLRLTAVITSDHTRETPTIVRMMLQAELSLDAEDRYGYMAEDELYTTNSDSPYVSQIDDILYEFMYARK